jgi:hypothetical protein
MKKNFDKAQHNDELSATELSSVSGGQRADNSGHYTYAGVMTDPQVMPGDILDDIKGSTNVGVDIKNIYAAALSVNDPAQGKACFLMAAHQAIHDGYLTEAQLNNL